jgi:hypothetical protein
MALGTRGPSISTENNLLSISCDRLSDYINSFIESIRSLQPSYSHWTLQIPQTILALRFTKNLWFADGTDKKFVRRIKESVEFVRSGMKRPSAETHRKSIDRFFRIANPSLSGNPPP